MKPTLAYPHSRGGSCSIIGGYVVATGASARSAGATSTPTSARGSALRRPPPAPRRPRPQARPQRLHAELLRRGHRPPLRHLARRPRLPSGPPSGSRAGYSWLTSQGPWEGAPGGEPNRAGQHRRRKRQPSERGDRVLDVQNPATGETIASVPVDSAESVAETVARVRANQAEWEALGIEGRYRGRASCAMGCSTTPSGFSTRCRRRPARSAPTPSNEPAYLADLINFYGTRAARFIGEEKVRPHTALLASKKLRVQYRPHPVVGIISPWNFPPDPRPRRRDPALQAGGG